MIVLVRLHALPLYAFKLPRISEPITHMSRLVDASPRQCLVVQLDGFTAESAHKKIDTAKLDKCHHRHKNAEVHNRVELHLHFRYPRCVGNTDRFGDPFD